MDYGKKRTLEKQRKVCDELLEIKIISNLFIFRDVRPNSKYTARKRPKPF